MNTRCPKTWNGEGRHVVGAENINPENRLSGQCLACGRRVERAHDRSPWWFNTDGGKVVTKSARSIYIAIHGDSASDVAALFGDSIAEANRAVHEGRTIDDTREFGTAKGTLRVEPGDQP